MEYHPPAYDIFNISASGVGTTLVPLTYEGTPSSTIGSTPVGLIVPEDLILVADRILIQNTTASPITVQLIAQQISDTGNVVTTVQKTPPIPVNANSVISLDARQWNIMLKFGFGLYAQSSAGSSANVFVKAYFVKGTGGPL